MGKRVSVVVLLLAAALVRGYAATITAATGGGTFGTGSTWLGGVAPGIGDVAVIPSTCTGNITVGTTITVAKIDMTGYTKTFSVSTGVTLTIAGDLLLSSASGFAFTGAGTVLISSTSTITSSGALVDVAFRFSGLNVTYTLNEDLVCTKQVSLFPSSNSSVCNYTATTNERLIARAGLTITGPSSVTTTQGSVVFEIQGGTLMGGGTVATVKNSINIVPSISGVTIATGGTGLSFNTGTITYTASTFGVTHAANNILTISGTCGLNTPGLVWENITVTAASKITLGSLLQVNHALTHANSGGVNYAGSGGWSVGSFTATTAGASDTLAAGVTYTVTGGITTAGTAAGAVVLTSSSGATKAILTVQQGATEDCLYTNTSLIDCSAGKTLWVTKPAITSCNNVVSRPMEPGQVAGAN